MTCDRKTQLNELYQIAPAVVRPCGVTIQIASQSFCDVGEISALLYWVHENAWAIFTPIIAFGLFVCFFGRKLFKIVLFLTTMALTICAGMFFCYQFFLYKEHASWVGWTILVFWILIGIAAGFLMLRVLRFGIFLLAAWGGILLGQIIWTSFVYYTASPAVYWICIIVFGALVGLLAMKMEELVLIWVTSFSGSFIFWRGIGMVAPGWPSNSELARLMKEKRIQEVDPRFYGYLFGIVLLTIVGLVIQIKQKRKDQKNGKQAYTKFRNHD